MKKIVFLFLLAVSFPVVGQNRHDADVSSLFIDAVAAYDEGETDRAVELLLKLTDIDPFNDAAAYYLGLCMLEKNDIQAAQLYLSEAAQLDSSNYWYQDKLASVYIYQGKVQESIATLERMRVLQPRNVEPVYQLVNLYARNNDFDKLLEALDEIENVQGKTEAVTTTRFEVLMRQNKPQDAWAALESFNEDFASAEILARMGDFKAMEGEDSLAVVLFDQALDAYAGYPAALLGKADVFRSGRRYDEYFSCLEEFASNGQLVPSAKAGYMESLLRGFDPSFLRTHMERIDSVVEKCISTHPSDSSVLRLGGTYYFTTDRYPRAAELFRGCVVAYPDNLGMTVLFLDALNAMDYWGELSIASDGAFQRFPQYPELLQYKASALYSMQQYQEVIATLETLISASRDNKGLQLYAYSLIGDCYHEAGNAKKAYKAYDKALKIDPRYVPVLNNYAYFLSLEGKNLKKAYKMSLITMQEEPDNATYLDTFGWIQHLQGKDIEAKQTFKRAMLYGGKESATILEHYATVLEALGDYATAKVYRDMAAKKDS